MAVINTNKYKSDDVKFIPANKPIYYIPTFRNITAESMALNSAETLKYIGNKGIKENKDGSNNN